MSPFHSWGNRGKEWESGLADVQNKARYANRMRDFRFVVWSTNHVPMMRVACVGSEAQALPGPPDGSGRQVEGKCFILHMESAFTTICLQQEALNNFPHFS